MSLTIHTERAYTLTKDKICTLHQQGEGNGNPLQYSCLGNPMDRGTWQPTVHVVARVNTTERLKQTNHTSANILWLSWLNFEV